MDAEAGTERERTAASLQRGLGELRRADLLLIATPMYSFGMPAALKAWVDQVVRVARQLAPRADPGREDTRAAHVERRVRIRAREDHAPTWTT